MVDGLHKLLLGTYDGGQVAWCASCASMPPPLRVRDRFSRPICCPWPGTSAPAGGWQQSHLFAGEYWDQDSQLLYLRARWYDPQIGRFISADPFEGRQRADWRYLNRPGGRQAAMAP